MLNIEKYKDEIKTGIVNGKDISCIVKKLKDGDCGECRNCVICSLNMLDWLSQEYEEPNPILTKEGKEFLRMMVTDFNIYDIEYFIKEEDENKVNNYLMINLRNGHVTTIYEKNSKECMLLKNMENHQRYTAKELGL